MVVMVSAKMLREDWHKYDDYDAFMLENGDLITALDDDNGAFHCKRLVKMPHDDVFKAEIYKSVLPDDKPVRLIKTFKTSLAWGDDGKLIPSGSDKDIYAPYCKRLGVSALNALKWADKQQAKARKEKNAKK